MLTTTQKAFTAILEADPTLTADERNALLARLRNPTRTPGAPMPRILSRAEVAELIGVSKTRVDQLARRGLFVKVLPNGQSRACGYTEASVRAFCEGKEV